MTCLTTPHSLIYDLPWLLKITVYRGSSKKKKPAFFPSGFRDRCQEKRRWSYHCRWNRWRHVIWRYKDNLPVAAKIWRESTHPGNDSTYPTIFGKARKSLTQKISLGGEDMLVFRAGIRYTQAEGMFIILSLKLLVLCFGGLKSAEEGLFSFWVPGWIIWRKSILSQKIHEFVELP